MDKTIRYFVCGHTAKGYINHLTSNLYEIDQVIILHHKSSILKTNIFQKLINYLINKTDMIEVIYNSDSMQYIDGIILRNESIAFVSEGIVDDYSQLEKDVTIEYLTSINDSILYEDLNLKRKKHLQTAYDYFKRALNIHDHLEEIYIEQMDFNKANEVVADFIQGLFQNVEKQKERSYTYERLFGTNTVEGSVNVVEHLISNIDNRIFIKGRAGTGKSVFMNRVLTACHKYNLDTEVYYCSFDPDSIDMLIIRELDYCLFDSTSPHEFFPEYEKDKIIDLYDLTVKRGTDEQFKSEINRVTNQYKQQLNYGMAELKKLKHIQHLDKLYLQDIDCDEDAIMQNLITYI